MFRKTTVCKKCLRVFHKILLINLTETKDDTGSFYTINTTVNLFKKGSRIRKNDNNKSNNRKFSLIKVLLVSINSNKQ